jgi:hypothetical protein
MKEIDMVLESVLTRGDLAHLVLLLWALASCAVVAFLLREVSITSARFDTLVHELARFNTRMEINPRSEGEPK